MALGNTGPDFGHTQQCEEVKGPSHISESLESRPILVTRLYISMLLNLRRFFSSHTSSELSIKKK